MADFIVFVLLFMLGASFGSFLNVLIDRIPKGKSIGFTRSVCEKCLRQIFILDLIPVMSFIILKARCRNCKAPIPTRIFLVELLCAALFPLTYYFAFFSLPAYILILVTLLILVAISTIDIESGIIPDKLLFLFGFISLVYLFMTNGNIYSHALSAVYAFAFFLLIFLITKSRGIGFGDVKFAFFIGFLLSIPQLIIAFYVAFLTGAIVSIILILLGIKKLKGESIPFGPFLSFGVVVSLLFEKSFLSVVGLIFNV